jgi:hypothetical protein
MRRTVSPQPMSTSLPTRRSALPSPTLPPKLGSDERITWRTLFPRLSSRRIFASFSFAIGAISALTSVASCSDECGNGKTVIDGVCLAPCNQDQCDDGLTCVRNVCRPECTSDNQCKADDTCEKVRNDHGDVGRYCYGPAMAESPYADDGASSPKDAGQDIEERCDSSSDCPQTVPHHCIAGACETQCALHEHCGRAGSCTGVGESSEGETVAYCQPDTLPRDPGQFGTSCLGPNEACDSANDFMCLSQGEGDTESYCTLRGCDSDVECPSGLFCSHNSVGSRPPCVSTCGLTGQPQSTDCIPEADIGAGRPYRCSPNGGLELTICLKRAFCASCESDADCRGEANQVCARGPDGNKTCTVLCTASLGSCPWGSATQCGVFDQERGVATCAPLFGACQGTGKGCEPCVDDADCPNGFCSFSGEQFCFDETVSCSCAAGEESCIGGGCPLTPSGLQMNCLSRRDGEAPSVCYGAEIAENSGMPLGCW